jgi:phage terminase large subunit
LWQAGKMSKTAKLELPPKMVPIFQDDARYRVTHGGRGSGKTRGKALMIAVDGYRLGRSGVSGVMLCAREHLNSLEESSMQEVKDAIRSVPWLDAYYEIGEKYIRSKDRRINFIFSGLRHNIDAVKSKARILRAWIDEAERVSEVAWRTLLPTVRSQGDWWQSEIWISYNPESEDSATHRRFRANPSPDCKIAQLNWNDNPWFPEVLNRERLEDKKFRPETYDHVWEGDFLTLTDAQVFRNRFRVSEFTPLQDWSGPYFGLDFGYAKDPTAGVKLWIKDNRLYIEYELHKVGLDIDQTVSACARALPQSTMHTVRCDSARPETIAYLVNHGMPAAVGAKKGRGSVEDGIEYMKSFEEIIIHPRCLNAIEEFTKYSYKTDALSGDILPKVEDKWNHIIDACRYGLEPMIRFKSQPRIRLL